MLINNMRDRRPERGNLRGLHLLSIIALLVVLFLALGRPAYSQDTEQADNYTQGEIVTIASRFFGMSAESVAEVMDVIFTDHGGPSGFIRGEEAGGAFFVGLRYGRGEMVMHDGETMPIFWRGPTAGWDFGGNATKTFTLIYNLNNTDDIFRRYPGVDGSAFFIAGLGVNYQRRGEVILAPIRAGVGTRLGVNIGYVKYSREAGRNPF